MIVSFDPPLMEPEYRLRRALKKFLRKLGLETSPQCMLWIRDEVLSQRTEADLSHKIRTTVLLAYAETHPSARAGMDGAFVCGQGRKIREFIDGELRKVMSEARMAGESND